jgi:hypothetical protein
LIVGLIKYMGKACGLHWVLRVCSQLLPIKIQVEEPLVGSKPRAVPSGLDSFTHPANFFCARETSDKHRVSQLALFHLFDCRSYSCCPRPMNMLFYFGGYICILYLTSVWPSIKLKRFWLLCILSQSSAEPVMQTYVQNHSVMYLHFGL